MPWFRLHLYSIVHFSLVFLFLAHILRMKKTPTSTLAWFFIVVIQPLVGLPLYVMFGGRKMRRKDSIVCKRPHIVDESDRLQKVLQNSGSPGARGCEHINFLKTGEDAYGVLMEGIALAKKSIFVETFIFAGDDVGKEVLKLLTIKAHEGLDVRILLDSLGSLMPLRPSMKEFIAAGGKYRTFMPILHMPFQGRVNLRNHRKLVVIDEEIAITGGMNIAREYMGPIAEEKRWTDLGIMIRGQIVGDLLGMFKSDWSFAGKEKIPELIHDSAEVKGPFLSQLVPSGPDLEFDTIYDWMISAIQIAKKRVWITTPYFIPDDSLAKALELAAKRGIDVQLLVPRKSNHSIADLVRKTYLAQVHASGVKVLQFHKMIHSKVFILDDSHGMVSTANLDGRSLLINYESGIVLFNEEHLKELETWFLDLCQDSEETLDEHSPLDTWVGGLARLLSPIL